MPNWCDTTWKVTGKDTGTLMRFYMDMLRATGELGGMAESERKYVDEDGEGKEAQYGWLGTIYLSAGYGMEELLERKFMMRGFDAQVSMSERKSGDGCDVVEIWLQTAWEPYIEDFRKMMSEKYPGLRAECLAEEPGCGIYVNTDASGDLFNVRWKVSYNTGGGSDDSEGEEYFSGDQEREFCDRVEEIADCHRYSTAKDIMDNAARIEKRFDEEDRSTLPYGGDAYLSIIEYADE